MSRLATNGPQEVVFLIPDISGFTRFLSDTEISHSRHIIEELIEIIARETKTLFELAEVEGDALFLYQNIDEVSAQAVFEVAKNTFTAFHQHLTNYERLRICSCGACSSAIHLSLKFIAHAGFIEFANVQGKHKPYGLEVIKAHRLMKNDIDGAEYILFSEDFTSRYPITTLDSSLSTGSVNYEEIGDIHYSFKSLSYLKKNLKAAEEQIVVPGKSLQTLIAVNDEIDAPLSIVYEVLSDFKYRPVWNSDAKVVDHNEEDIYQIGKEHYCIINHKKHRVKTVGSQNSKLEFGEQILDTGPFNELNLYFIFDKSVQSAERTKLSIEIRANVKSLLRPLVYLIVKPKLKKKIPEALRSIKQISESLAKSRSDDQAPTETQS
ncbi:MAG: DUF2652 domain-containing protein, partial [Bacteroidota bacterium]